MDIENAVQIAVEALRMPTTVTPIDRSHVARRVVANLASAGLLNASGAQWAAWFRESADQADDLTEGQREGFRIAAEHLVDPAVQARVEAIPRASVFNLAPARQDAGR